MGDKPIFERGWFIKGLYDCFYLCIETAMRTIVIIAVLKMMDTI